MPRPAQGRPRHARCPLEAGTIEALAKGETAARALHGPQPGTEGDGVAAGFDDPLLERPVSAHATLQEDVGMIHSITRQLGEDPLEVGEVQAGRTKEMIDSEGKR